MRAHGPDGLHVRHVPCALEIAVAVFAFQTQVDELALPPGDGWE